MNRLKLFRPKDLLLYLLIVSFTFAVLLNLNTNDSDRIVVKISGTTAYQFSLLEEATKTIKVGGRKLMDIVIEDEDAFIINSKCSLHLCEEGSIEKTSALVCVPNRVIITYDTDKIVIDNPDRQEYDLMTK